MNWLTMTRRGLAVGTLVAVGFGTSSGLADPPERPRFTLVDLGTLGGEFSRALGMNDHGAVVGYATTGDDPVGAPHAFLWDRGATFDLGTLGGDWTEARDINNRGQIVGHGLTAGGAWHGIYWYDGIRFDLNDVVFMDEPIPPTSVDVTSCFAPLRTVLEANAINDDGVIAACGLVEGDDAVHGLLLLPEKPFFLREPHFRAVNLGRLPGAPDCVVLDVNERDESVGASGSRAFFCDGSWTMEELESQDRVSVGRALNDLRTVAGWSGATEMEPLACLWRDGHRRDLATPPRWISVANDLNEDDLAVGWIARNMGEPLEAVLWEGCQPVRLGAVTELPRDVVFPWETLEEATAINAAGRIVGHGRSPDGRVRAFLLVPFGEWPEALVDP